MEQKFDKIIFATSNQGKMDEIRMIMKDSKLPIVSLKEAGIDDVIAEKQAQLNAFLGK